MPQPYFTEMVGEGSTFRELQRFVRQATGYSDPVLLMGELGAGKEAVARSIHLGSNRRSYPFLVIDCSLYYERELERELFGGEELDADRRCRKGILEFSSHGTCYLANVEELSDSVQERLYNYVETGYLQSLGSDRPVPSHVRLILSTDKDLGSFSDGGLFSTPLLEAISRHQFVVQPLRRHPEDIKPFARHMAHLFALEHAGVTSEIEFSNESWSALETYPWPGNYDELKRELLRIFRAGVYRVTPQTLSPEISQYWLGRQGEPKVRQVVEELEDYIREFKLMARLDAEYGAVLLDTEDWDLELKHYTRA